nr:FKBP12-interacting protein of 37 kDa isoform X2 [Ipomoea batatas]
MGTCFVLINKLFSFLSTCCSCSFTILIFLHLFLFPWLYHQMEKAKKKETALIVNIAKRDQEIAESKMHGLAMKLALQKSQNAKLKVTLKDYANK